MPTRLHNPDMTTAIGIPEEENAVLVGVDVAEAHAKKRRKRTRANTPITLNQNARMGVGEATHAFYVANYADSPRYVLPLA